MMVERQQHPNILLLMPDQLRADFVGCYGADFARTPNLDRLAAEGTRYTDTISPHPLCIPARASLLTGHNAVSTGVITNGNWLRPDHAACGMPTIAEVLTEVGYVTAAIGKMHFMPWDIAEGFQFRRIAEDKRHVFIEDDYADFLAEHGFAKPFGPEEAGYAENLMASISTLPPELQVDNWVKDEAVAFLRKQTGKSEPFIAMIGFPGPHDPYNPPEKWIQGWDPTSMPATHLATEVTEVFRKGQIAQNRKGSAAIDMEEFPDHVKQRIRLHYSVLTQNIDGCIGEILQALDANGLADNTVVIATSDHGDLLGDFDLLGKNNFLEPSIRIPLIIRDAAQIVPAVEDRLATLTDVFATIAGIAGAEISGRGDSYPLPGLDLPLTGQRRVAMGVIGSGMMITDGHHKLARYKNEVATLHDITLDPMEQHDLIEDLNSAHIRDRLDASLTKEILDALADGHIEKSYEYATMTPTHPSHKRDWTRPYPVGAQQKKEIQPL